MWLWKCRKSIANEHYVGFVNEIVIISDAKHEFNSIGLQIKCSVKKYEFFLFRHKNCKEEICFFFYFSDFLYDFGAINCKKKRLSLKSTRYFQTIVSFQVESLLEIQSEPTEFISASIDLSPKKQSTIQQLVKDQ